MQKSFAKSMIQGNTEKSKAVTDGEIDIEIPTTEIYSNEHSIFNDYVVSVFDDFLLSLLSWVLFLLESATRTIDTSGSTSNPSEDTRVRLIVII